MRLEYAIYFHNKTHERHRNDFSLLIPAQPCANELKKSSALIMHPKFCNCEGNTETPRKQKTFPGLDKHSEGW